MVNSFEKRSLEATIGAIEQRGPSVSVKVGLDPEARLLLKPGGEMRNRSMEGKGEKQKDTHTHTSSVFLIHMHEHLQLVGRRDGWKRAFLHFSCQTSAICLLTWSHNTIYPHFYSIYASVPHVLPFISVIYIQV